MIDARFRPLATPTAKKRTRSAFKSTWGKTLNLLERELGQLRATNIIIQAGFSLDQIRNDGWPRGGATARHPAVRLSFRDRSDQPLSFPCDTYDRYEHNLHAIALSLEALRAVNRYGVTRGHEQYKGFAQLEAGPDTNTWTLEAAASWVGDFSSLTAAAILADPAKLAQAYRAAARKLHPDVASELTAEWSRLQSAKRLLDAHFALRSRGAPA